MSKVNKKKRNKRLKSLVLLLFLTIVMLSTATYAWFTSNKTVKIDTINVNIAATSGLQISADAITWKSLLTNGDLTGVSTTYATAANNLTATMGPVSTAGTIETGLLKFYSGSVEGDSGGNMALTTAATTDAGNLYVVFDIFLKTEAAATVYLEKGSGVIPSTPQDDKGLQNAARYAFLTEGNGASTTAPATAQGWKNGTALTVIEPNYDVHTQTGIDNAKRYYGYTDATAPGPTGASPVAYFGVDGVVNETLLGSTNPASLASPNGVFKNVSGTYYRTNAAYSTAANGFHYISGFATSGSAQSGYIPVFNQLQPGITKVRVYMWVEGQDIDCENNASGTNLTYTISLTLNNAS